MSLTNGPAGEAFTGELRDALRNLFNPIVLRDTPLLKLFALKGREDPLSALQSILRDAIKALEPGADVPLQSSAWRVYQILTYRYLEQLTQREVADDLGFSIRQLRREEEKAIQVLADHLLARYHLTPDTERVQATGAQLEIQDSPADSDTPERRNELEWLGKSLPSETVDLVAMIGTALTVIRPLVQESDAQLRSRMPAYVPPVVGQVSTLHQALLGLFTAAVRFAQGGEVVINVQAEDATVCVYVRASTGEPPSPSLQDEIRQQTEMAQQLVNLFGGSLSVQTEPGQDTCFVATLGVSTAEQTPVLVIDDNVDTLLLVQRQLSGTRYRFVELQDTQRALAVAEELQPTAIVIDIMLPCVDGWQLLGRFREHPKTQRIPIIVCTILPQERLALTLGAAGFLRKPFSRESLLSALDRLTGLHATGSQ